jgi:hypothetical protein
VIKSKFWLIFILKILIIIDGYGQAISVGNQIQRHDYRTVIDNRIVKPWAKDIIGVNTYYISYTTKLKSKLNLGIGLGYEIATTPAQLKSTLINNFNDIKNGIAINRYVKNLIFIPIEYTEPLNKRFQIGIQLMLGFGFHREFGNTKIIPQQRSILNIATIFYNDLELNPFIRIKFNKINIDIGARLIHFKRVDDAIFYREFFDQWDTVVDTKIYSKPIDMYNPLKLNLTLGYTFKKN